MYVTSWQLVEALRDKHSNDFFMTEVKNGPTGWAGSNVRMDAVAIKKSWSQPNIIGYEIKVSRADFEQDHKWPKYYEQCHTFSFVCPRGLIQPEELPGDVGLIWFNPDKGTLYTKRKAKYRTIDLHAGLLLYIIMNRIDSERVPVYSDCEAFLRDYVNNKKSKKELGYNVKSKMAKEIQSLNDEVESLQRRVKSLSEYEESYHETAKILGKFGLSMSLWGLERELESMTGSGISRQTLRKLERANEELTSALNEIKPQVKSEAGD
ncbi:MmcB family DNA repair protein [Enterococcus sp. AZ109]|uniref:MmcB family DNA repair protein n=1 Tax=Enterococcus sp. AZ109 TaxID=2774634 RepID=UPI003F6885C5